MDKRKVHRGFDPVSQSYAVEEVESGPLKFSSLVPGVSFTDKGPSTKLVYICHPLSGDIAGNIDLVRGICEAIVRQELPKPPEAQTLRKVVPVAPHLLFPTFMDDEAVEARELALRWCLELVARMDEIWVFGDVMSPGMRLEIEAASSWGIPVLFKDEKTFGKVRRGS